MEKPGDCSPSRSVVSNMRTTSPMVDSPYSSNAKARLLVKFIFILLLIILSYTTGRGFRCGSRGTTSFSDGCEGGQLFAGGGAPIPYATGHQPGHPQAGRLPGQALLFSRWR